jgi:hypothetical protein
MFYHYQVPHFYTAITPYTFQPFPPVVQCVCPYAAFYDQIVREAELRAAEFGPAFNLPIDKIPVDLIVSIIGAIIEGVRKSKQPTPAPAPEPTPAPAPESTPNF